MRADYLIMMQSRDLMMLSIFVLVALWLAIPNLVKNEAIKTIIIKTYLIIFYATWAIIGLTVILWV